ncbi:histidine triad nucleotide-binding protein [Ignatzschineria rhizosphaerae]|uniref:Histidine triad nucleotide-binding protein n=1 Tax=Ignatzschineria rhizosphaerae TaxID=2923279 RepID=A0ABY3X7I0_9GAMM|nr:histidine triad nucleotide-binding protein [Ignatzschineria rhizosphaerae]UNM96691.1 histidine triad nucleotide-binding protein [Ignatzschineria rhizosphaerae]
MSTIFSKIIQKEIPAKIVYEDDEVLAFEDISPQAPVHILIIPKKEIPTLNHLQAEDAVLMGKLFLVAQKIAKEQGFAEQGYRTVFNCNEDGGQTVDHIHLHLLAGRSLTWPPG